MGTNAIGGSTGGATPPVQVKQHGHDQHGNTAGATGVGQKVAGNGPAQDALQGATGGATGGGPTGAVAGASMLDALRGILTSLQQLIERLAQMLQGGAQGGGPVQQGGGCGMEHQTPVDITPPAKDATGEVGADGAEAPAGPVQGDDSPVTPAPSTPPTTPPGDEVATGEPPVPPTTPSNPTPPNPTPPASTPPKDESPSAPPPAPPKDETPIPVMPPPGPSVPNRDPSKDPRYIELRATYETRKSAYDKAHLAVIQQGTRMDGLRRSVQARNDSIQRLTSDITKLKATAVYQGKLGAEDQKAVRTRAKALEAQIAKMDGEIASMKITLSGLGRGMQAMVQNEATTKSAMEKAREQMYDRADAVRRIF